MTEFGVYAGPGATGVAGATAFANATGAPITRRTEFLPYQSWAALSASAWVLEAHRGSSHVLDLRVPLLTNESRAAGETLADIAAGKRDDVWRRFAANLAANPFPTTLALGWEFNGGWYPWTATDPTAFAEAYRRVWSIIVTTPGTGHVSFLWCVANGRFSGVPSPELAYPGDRCVDAGIGVDFYDYSWLYAQRGTSKAVRDQVFGLLTTGNYSLSYWSDFAKSRSRPLLLPEWGPAIRSDGGGDNPDFVHRVLDLFDKFDVGWASYFEAADTTVDHKIATGDTRLPLSAAAFKSRMSARVPA